MKKVIKKVFLTIKDFLLKYRKTLTLLSALVGLGLAWLVLKCQVTESIFGFVEDDILIELKKGLFLIVLATPTSYYLWFLRNEDKLVQLEQQKESNRFNSFSAALRLFTEKDNLEANAVGLKLLMKIRNVDKVYVDQIDLATPYKNLYKAKLSGVDLSHSKLMGANLAGATLKGANLSCADLSNANLSNADLSGAELLGIRFIMFKNSFTINEIDQEYLKDDFRYITNSVCVKIIGKNGKYYLEKMDEVNEGS